MTDWFECPAAACRYGHLHDRATDGLKWHCQRPGCHIVACVECVAPWHEGLSCEEYKKADHTTVGCKIEEISGTTTVRQCPSCKQGMYKSGGCDHIVCRCGFQFCYLCSTQFCPELEIPGVLFIRHTPVCLYRPSCRSALTYYAVYGLELNDMLESQRSYRFSSIPGEITTFDCTSGGTIRTSTSTLSC